MGILNHWNAGHGYGFIRHAVENYRGQIVRITDRAVGDTFCHVTAAQAAGIDLVEGDVLLFDIATDRKTGRPKAVNLEKIGRGDEKTAAA